MKVYLFQPCFARLVEIGVKPHTIRPKRKRPTKIGDKLSLRTWTGKPYRSKQRELRKATCTAVESLEIGACGAIVWAGKPLGPENRDNLARRDGFGDAAEMVNWFRDTHGLPFSGDLISWA